MVQMAVNGIEVHVQMHGQGDPVLLLAGLSGVGRGWGEQIDRFASTFLTIVPDQRGTGDSTRSEDGYTIEAHAVDMAEVLRTIGCGPAHVVGSSTGGAIAQVLALDHPDVVRSISLISSWGRADAFFRHQFAVRKEILRQEGSEAYARVTALFLFSPWFFRNHYDEVTAWCETARSVDPDIMTKRIDMILKHDQLDRLPEIAVPSLVVVGRADACTPPQFSEELAEAIPGSKLTVLDGGHLIYKERPDEFHRSVTEFLTIDG